jgi:hypothetical protein
MGTLAEASDAPDGFDLLLVGHQVNAAMSRM